MIQNIVGQSGFFRWIRCPLLLIVWTEISELQCVLSHYFADYFQPLRLKTSFKCKTLDQKATSTTGASYQAGVRVPKCPKA